MSEIVKRLWLWISALFAVSAATHMVIGDYISMFTLCLGGLTFYAMSSADHSDLG